MRRGLWLWAIVGLIAARATALPALADESLVDYTSQIKPVLRDRCYACHGALKQQAGLRLDTGEAIRRGGEGGPAVEPGDAETSLLIERVREADSSRRMPPEGPPLTDDQIRALRSWIEQGAASPADEAPEPDPRDHWAFRAPVRPTVPAVANAEWARNPIDAFLAAAHEQRGLVPLPTAEPHVVLRRVYLDLIGLPPTREELRTFLADPSEDHYRRIVDRLLESPQYGERWARHWMDVWRYSDWYGRRSVPDVLNSYAMIWRWRDWIVRGLNEDRPYDAMVRAMLAADELSPGDPSEQPATGFLVRNFYRWNYNSWMKDNVEHTARAFLGLTIQCAHCHDHKYDPITQRDYFAMRAVFEPLEIRHDRLPGEPDPGVYPKYDYGKAYKPIASGLVRVYDENRNAETFVYTRGESRNVVPKSAPVAPGAPAFLGGRDLGIHPVALPAEVAYPGLQQWVRDEERRKAEEAVASAERSLAQAQAQAETAQTAWRRALETSTVPLAFVADVEAVNVPAFADAVPEAERSLDEAWAAVERSRRVLRIEQAHLTNAQAQRTSLVARIAADQVRYHSGQAMADAHAAAVTAAAAQNEAAVTQAELSLARDELAAFEARRKARDDPKAQPAAAKAEQQVIASRQALHAAKAARAAAGGSSRYAAITPVYPSTSTGRRAALARWITRRDHPLTARVAVNHLWRWHFGTPLVATTADFGRNGKPPTHPELLDWLAVELMEPSAPGTVPWSMKALHRRIVTSRAYRMRSHDPAGSSNPNATIDPENRLVWKFPSSRMEAEVVRDALLHVAGALDLTIGGPDIDFGHGLASRRRSLYFTHHGEARMPFLELFDAADACEAYTRSVSVLPQQALALVNNDLTLDLARKLADRLPADPSAFVVAAFEQVLSRPPTPAERAVAEPFLTTQAERIRQTLDRHGPPRDDPEFLARRDLVHALFSHHDFVTIH